jgi:hypothetical protein
MSARVLFLKDELFCDIEIYDLFNPSWWIAKGRDIFQRILEAIVL